MASRASVSDDSLMIKPLPKNKQLRDYLLDDMSSCSSNGFRLYPRRQCCTTIRFLLDADLNRTGKLSSKQHRRSIVQSKMDWTSNFKPKQSSMSQKASAVMIHAFKRLPFAVAGFSRKANHLPRSLSRKLLKHGFWKKADHHNKEVKQLKSFGDLLKEKEITPPPSPTPELRISTCNSSSWSSSDFTATTESFTTGKNSEANLVQNDVADELSENKKTTNGNRVDTTTATATANATNYTDTTENEKKWQDKHDEQFSPVSVMDFPNDNFGEEDEVSSYVGERFDVKGTKQSMSKNRVFKRVHQLEPLKLEDRIAQSVLDLAQEKNQIETRAMALLRLMKSTVSSHHSLKYEVVETVLLGFFKENALGENVSDYEVLQRAKDWMEQEMFMDLECDSFRQIYLREMENGVKWSNYDHQLEKVNVSLEVECEIFNSLVNDVLTEFYMREFEIET